MKSVEAVRFRRAKFVLRVCKEVEATVKTKSEKKKPQNLQLMLQAMDVLRPFFKEAFECDQHKLTDAMRQLQKTLHHRQGRVVEDAICTAAAYLHYEMVTCEPIEFEYITDPNFSIYFCAMYWWGRSDGWNSGVEFKSGSGG